MNTIAKYSTIAVASIAALAGTAYVSYTAGAKQGAAQERKEVISQLEAKIVGPSPRTGSQAVDWVKSQAYNLSCGKYSDDVLTELKAEIEKR